MDLNWQVSNFNTKVIEEKEGGVNNAWAVVKGTALAVEESNNNRKYTFDNLVENNGKEFNVIVGHHEDYDNPAHNVGEGKYILEGVKLNFDSKIRNTPQHPDIVEKIRDGLVAPSVQGGFKRAVKKNGSVVIEGLKIPLIALVNRHVRGMPSAVAAIEESVNLEELEEMKPIINEGDSMSEDDVQKQISERDEEINKLKEQLELQKKEIIVERVLSLNSKLSKEELMKLSESELMITEKYEKTLKESNEQKNGEPVGIVEKDESKRGTKIEESDDIKGVVVEKDELGRKGITMSSSRYNQFNKDMVESIYR